MDSQDPGAEAFAPQRRSDVDDFREAKGAARRALVALSIAATAASVLLLVATVLLLLREAIGRGFLNSPSIGTSEWTGVLLAGLILSALPTVMARGPAIEMTMVYSLVGPLGKLVFDIARAIAVLTFFALLAVAVIPWALRATEIGEHTIGLIAVPVWPAKLLFAAAVVTVVLISVVQLLAAAGALLTRRHPSQADGPEVS